MGKTVSTLTGAALMRRWELPDVGSADLVDNSGYGGEAAYVDVLGKLWRFLGQAD